MHKNSPLCSHLGSSQKQRKNTILIWKKGIFQIEIVNPEKKGVMLT